MSVILSDEGASRWLAGGPIWNHERPQLPHGWEAINDHGAGSLKHAAMRQVLQNQDKLKHEMFELVPWHIAKYLWDALGRCNKQTLFMWRLMATMYPTQFRQLSPSYRLSTLRPGTLEDYYSLVNSDSYCWRAILTIGHQYATAADLVKVACIKNLVALEIGAGKCVDSESYGFPFKDGIVRSWMELAKSEGTLQHLRILRVYNQRELTTAALRSLGALPQLQLVVAYQCDEITKKLREYAKPKDNTVILEGWAARRLDWVWKDHGSDVAVSDLRSLTDVYKDGLAKHSASQDDPPKLGSDIPIMEFQLPTADHGNKDKVSYRARYRANEIVLFTRSAAKRGQKRAGPSLNKPQRAPKMKDVGDPFAMINGYKNMA